MTAPLHLVVGDTQHGVARYARQVAGWTGAEVVTTTGDVAPGARVHLHFTDRPHGATPAEAAAAVEALAARTRLTVTLHDVPQPTDGPTFPERVACYRRVLAAADGWVTNSEHERRLLLRWCLPPSGTGTVVPLPVVPLPRRVVAPAATPAPTPTGTASTTPAPRLRSVGLFGFVYPGKGHLPVLRATARALREHRGLGPVELVVAGRAAPGHAAELARLVAEGLRLGVPVRVTGAVPEADVHDLLGTVDVPVSAHRNVSASGSVNSWLAAHRRPLVRDGVYAREMAALRPGSLTLFRDADLADAVAAALRDPASTWLGGPGARDTPGGTGSVDPVDLAPWPVHVAQAYGRWWSTLGRGETVPGAAEVPA